MTADECYQLALMVFLAGERGEPLPDVPEDCLLVCQRLWEAARKYMTK